MTATQLTVPAQWRIFKRSDYAKLPNNKNGSWQRFLYVWTFIASAAAHSLIVALLVNNAAEPLPMGPPIVVELVVEKSGETTIDDATKNLKPVDTPSLTNNIRKLNTGRQPDRIKGSSIPTVVGPVRTTKKITVDVLAPSKLMTSIPEPKTADVLFLPPRTHKQSIDREKPDPIQRWTANIPVPIFRPKPSTQPKVQQVPKALKNDGPAQPTILEEVGEALVKQGTEDKIRSVWARLPAQIGKKGETAPGVDGISSTALVGLKKKRNIGTEGISSAALLPGNPPPRYPARAVRRGWQGRVILDVEVLPSGKAGLVSIATSSGYGVLDRSARKTVQNWRFRVARRAGIPYRSKVRVPVQFKLEK